MIPFFVLLGVLTGLLSGYLGIGGGIVLVPILTELFLARDFGLDQTMTTAFATSLFIAIFTTGAAAWKQWRQNNMLPRAVPATAVGAIAGSQLGTWLGSNLTGELLIVLFSLFLMFSATILFTVKEHTREEGPHFSAVRLAALGLVTGIIGGLFGIGGGIVMVPVFILLFHYPSAKVAGTSSTVALLLTVSAVIGYLTYGSERAVGAALSLGVIDMSVAIPIVIGTIPGARWGAKLNKRFGGAIYQKIFAVLLLIVAIRMVLRGLQ